jgi:hypothetical protein
MRQNVIIIVVENSHPYLTFEDCCLYRAEGSNPFVEYTPTDSEYEQGVFCGKAYSEYYNRWYEKDVFFANDQGMIRAKDAIVEKTAFLQLLLKEEFDERSKKLKQGKERALYKLGYTV